MLAPAMGGAWGVACSAFSHNTPDVFTFEPARRPPFWTAPDPLAGPSGLSKGALGALSGVPSGDLEGCPRGALGGSSGALGGPSGALE